MPSSDFPYRFGWLPDLPDPRDYTKDTPKVADLLSKLPKTASLPASTDLRSSFPPVFDQGSIGSCTANAAAALLDYYKIRQNRAQGIPPAPPERQIGTKGGSNSPKQGAGTNKGASAGAPYPSASRLFIYKCTRDLMMAKGDSGAYIRTTMGSLALFGSPPEKYWDYIAKELDTAPPAFCYSFASNFQAISYFRLDPIGASANTRPPEGFTPNVNQSNSNSAITTNKISIPATKANADNANIASNIATSARNTSMNIASTSASAGGSIPAPSDTLVSIKETLAGGLPAMFGFTVYDSIRSAIGGKIPFPATGEKVLGGHAVLAVGYDDNLSTGDCVGAFIIRNSWGESWGEKGYGYLPYEYLLQGIAQDWWALVKAEWVDTTQFGV